MNANVQQDGGITASELQAELDTLRSLRRRSISQPSDGIDPDLPPSPTQSKYGHSLSPPGSPIVAAYQASSTSVSPVDYSPLKLEAETRILDPNDGISEDSSLTLSGTLGIKAKGLARSDASGVEDSAISELFWLPARLHPEIAPQEFRAFIRDQTKPENLMRRSGSMLGRKKSMLSRQYKPTESDLESPSSSEPSTPSTSNSPSRTGSFRRSTGLERLTLNDLQRLETLARQAAEEGQTGAEGEAKLKHLVRRSLSLNPAALLSAADKLTDDDEDTPLLEIDNVDSPLIVPPPGSIIRRSARTKIRKNSLLGDGGGHRFGPSRRAGRASPLNETGDASFDDESGDLSRRVSASGSQYGNEEGDDEGNQSSISMADQSQEISGPLHRSQHIQPPSDEPMVLPVQYMAPSPPPTTDTVATELTSLDLTDHQAVRPGRSGVDLPPQAQLQSSPKDSFTTALSTSSDLEVKDLNTSSSLPAGSLRSTRRAGVPAQPASPGRTTSPPSTIIANSTSTSDFPTDSKPVQTQIRRKENLAEEEIRPALPHKVSQEKSSPAVADQRQLASQVKQSPAPPLSKPITTSSRPTQGLPSLPLSATTQPVPPKEVAPLAKSPVAAQANQTIPTPIPAKDKETKKSGWARLGLSRSNKEDSNNPDVDDGASILSTSSVGSAFSLKDKKAKKATKKDKESVNDLRKQSVSAQSSIPTTPAVVEKVDKVEKDKDKDKDKGEGSGGFFGGLFGSKRKSEPSGQPQDPAHSRKGSHVQAHLLLPPPPPTASGMLTPDGKYVNFYRLPIHIERAVYRLSHIKLANPRRPLYEQVLISNLMFWYLGVINKSALPAHLQQQQHRGPPGPPAQQMQSGPSRTPGQPQTSTAQSAQQGVPTLPPQNQINNNALTSQHQNQHHQQPPHQQQDNANHRLPPVEANQQHFHGDQEQRSSSGHDPIATRPSIPQAPVILGTSPDLKLDYEPGQAIAQNRAHSANSSISPYHTTESVSLPRLSAEVRSQPREIVEEPLPSISAPSGRFPVRRSSSDRHQASEAFPSERPVPVAARRSPTEPGFQVMHRPQRTESMSASPAASHPHSGHDRRVSDLDALDIISAYSDEERRRSLQNASEVDSSNL